MSILTASEQKISRGTRLAAAGNGQATELDAALKLYRVGFASRFLDEIERELVAAGEGFFHVAGAGHEGAAALALCFEKQDWLHCHYRDKALMLARGVSAEQFFHSLICTAKSHSAGRQMSAHISDPSRNVMSIVGPVGNSGLHAVGAAKAVKDRDGSPIVYCSIGDGTSQQGEMHEAIAEADRCDLPVLFCVQDNGYSISTVTRGKTFYDRGEKGEPDHFHGVLITRVDGRDPLSALPTFQEIIARMRSTRRPEIVVFDVERLSHHTNADDERVYRTEEERQEALETGDPLQKLREDLQRFGYSDSDREELEELIRIEVRNAAESARRTPDPAPVYCAKKPLPDSLSKREESAEAGTKPLTMMEAIRDTLRARMESDDRVTLFGEDLEDPKGDVFGVTRGLSTSFPGRVQNSPLAEATIVGVSVGRALAGERPVAFLQFADFFPIAFNQIASEMASMYWRSAGGWECPLIILAACGAYRPGLGPFHAQTFEAVAAHTPGLDVFCPSRAADAAGMLNFAFDSGRPTVLFYPKVCLNDPERTASVDPASHIVPAGRARQLTKGNDLTCVTWGSTAPLCERAADELIKAGVGVDLFDLRSLSPWDRDTIADSARRTRRLLVVHEDNQSCGFGAEIVASVCEAVPNLLAARRSTRDDVFVPCNFSNQLSVLPTFTSILEDATELLGLDLRWSNSASVDGEDGHVIRAQGSSPADQTVTVLSWKVKPGDRVTSGRFIAEAEADKAVFEMKSPQSGTVRELLVPESEPVRVGTPLVRLQPDSDGGVIARVAREEHGTPEISGEVATLETPTVGEAQTVAVSTIYTRTGTQTVSNAQFEENFAERAGEIAALTNIESRPHAGEGETVFSLAVDVAKRALEAEGVLIEELGAVVCHTTTPDITSPSLACRLLAELAVDVEPDAVAFDLNAACSGYLYAMASAYDHLLAAPPANRRPVLVVTSEVLSPILDPEDFATSILFGDAATATLLFPEGSSIWAAKAKAAPYRMHRPLVFAAGESGESLFVPQKGQGFIEMKGRRVFSEAVRKMADSLEKACADAGCTVEDLTAVVPHQANGRIMEAVARRLKLPQEAVWSNIETSGNTSSSSIPLCMATHPAPKAGAKIGLCAFGGGFTYGAAVMTATGR